jgi:hypothetical protein
MKISRIVQKKPETVNCRTSTFRRKMENLQDLELGKHS